MIICAALRVIHSNNTGRRLEDLIICGHRHGDCFRILEYLDINREGQEQGFITHKGEFLNRQKAYTHAVKCGQISETDRWYRKDNKVPNELYSEDLY